MLEGWKTPAGRYQHVPAEVLAGIAKQVGGLLWDAAEDPGDDDEGDGTASALAAT